MAKATVAEGRAENQGILRNLGANSGGGGIHPDLLDHLIELAAAAGCDRVNRRGVRLLVHRASGVIVGCGSGTTYWLRTAGVPRGAGARWAERFSGRGAAERAAGVRAGVDRRRVARRGSRVGRAACAGLGRRTEAEPSAPPDLGGNR